MHDLPRLGVNIDHVATLRQLRGTPYPDILEAARRVERAGAHQITVHLREDRRHIQDEDVRRLRAELRVPLNLEMAATEEMVRFATRTMPDWACLVPEKRQEVTTEGGLDLAGNRKRVGRAVERLKKAGIRVSLFVEPSARAVSLSRELGADAVEFHTGRFCDAVRAQPTTASRPDRAGRGVRKAARAQSELERIRKAAEAARKAGLLPHAGHGIDYENIRQLTALVDPRNQALLVEYNIGHAIVCRAALVGMERAVQEMLSAIRAP